MGVQGAHHHLPAPLAWGVEVPPILPWRLVGLGQWQQQEEPLGQCLGAPCRQTATPDTPMGVLEAAAAVGGLVAVAAGAMTALRWEVVVRD